MYTWARRWRELRSVFGRSLSLRHARGVRAFGLQRDQRVQAVWSVAAGVLPRQLTAGKDRRRLVAERIFNLDSGFPFTPQYNTNGIYFQGSGYGSIRPSKYLGGAGTSTSNQTFEGLGNINPNFKGNGTAYLRPRPIRRARHSRPPRLDRRPAFTQQPGRPGLQRS